MNSSCVAFLCVFSLCVILPVSPADSAGGDGSMRDAFMPGAEDTISLPSVPPKGHVSIEEAIWLRRSVRRYSGETPSADAVSRLLWAAQGITDAKSGLRSTPSAGATYPLEVYLATSEYLAHYIPGRHCLVIAMREDVRTALAAAALGQDWVARAPLVFVFTAAIARTARRYDERANLYVPIEVGCASENLMLEAAALGLGSVAVGAFKEKEVARALGLPKGWDPYLIMPVGVPAKEGEAQR
jgi:SagB-type dehydrogenase family enzyme